MAGEKIGRNVTISVDAVVVATARTKGLTINNEPVDVTSDGDLGIQRFLAEPGQKSVEVSLEGLYYGGALADIALSNALIKTVVLNYTTYTITGSFFMSSYNEGMTYNDGVTFSATLQSSGAVIKAAV